jgi:hypothetical protein
MVCNSQRYWGFGLYPSSWLLKEATEQHDVSETGCVSVHRWGEKHILLDPLERASLNHWTMLSYNTQNYCFPTSFWIQICCIFVSKCMETSWHFKSCSGKSKPSMWGSMHVTAFSFAVNLINSMELGPSWSPSATQEIPNIWNPQCSLPCSQKPSTSF